MIKGSLKYSLQTLYKSSLRWLYFIAFILLISRRNLSRHHHKHHSQDILSPSYSPSFFASFRSLFPPLFASILSKMPGGPDEWLQIVRKCQYLPETDLKRLCEMVKELLMEESNIQPISTPVTICGDVHGQFYDLLELFRVGGDLPDTNYVFMVRQMWNALMAG